MGKWLGIADETVFGTPVTPPTAFLDCLAIDLHPEREPAEVMSANFIGPTSAALGSYKIVGEVEISPNSENIMKLLKYLIAAPETQKDPLGDRWYHEYWPSDDLKFGTFYSVDAAQPDGANVLQFTSVIATEMRLEALLNAFVSTRFSLLGQKDTKVSKPSVGTFSTVKQFFSLDALLFWDLTGTVEEVNVRAISLTYSRAIPEDFMAMNDYLLAGFIPGEAKLEGSIDLIWKDWVAYQAFWGGVGGPAKAPARSQLSVVLVGPSLGGTGTYQYNRMRVQIPSVIITSIKQPIAGREFVTQTFEFKADRGTISTHNVICKVDLVNALATD